MIHTRLVLLVLAGLMALAAPLAAQDPAAQQETVEAELPAGEAAWLRYPAISPDGSTLVFSYQGDLWTVPAVGGDAVQLTRHPAYDYRPVWSPDGRQIAFASDRFGSFHVFLIDAEENRQFPSGSLPELYLVALDGGRVSQLTTLPAEEVPFAGDGRTRFRGAPVRFLSVVDEGRDQQLERAVEELLGRVGG